MSLKRVLDLFRKYPQISWLGARSRTPRSNRRANRPDAVLAVQLIPDGFYLLFFDALIRAIRSERAMRAEGVVVRSISGAIGVGWIATLKRSSAFAALYLRPWVNAFSDFLDRIAYRSTSMRPVADLVDWIEAGRLWRNSWAHNDLVKLEVDGVLIGDLVVDSYLRFRPSPQFNGRDPLVRRVLWQALRDLRRAAGYFEKRRPCAYLTSHTTYVEHGIATRVALRSGIPVWSFGSLARIGKRITTADFFHTPDSSQYRIRFESLPNKNELLLEADRQLNVRLSGGIDAATSYMRQSAYASADVKLPSGLQGAVVIFLHDFYDSPHVYGDLVFVDFWQWICFTIETLERAGIAFFVKPHPNQIALGDSVLKTLGNRYPGLQWLPQSASNTALVRSGVACGVTVYGTVAHELAYLGVPTIACARHPHHAFDFCRTAHGQDEYRALLLDYRACPLGPEEMRWQALAFYVMHNLLDQPSARLLQQDYAALWKICNDPAADEAEVKRLLAVVEANPAFLRLSHAIAHGGDAL